VSENFTAPEDGVYEFRLSLRKDIAPCCNAKRDSLGRLPIGYCGPECERRPEVTWLRRKREQT
jgi:hypothetical protein